jgi:hypothetical protein
LSSLDRDEGVKLLKDVIEKIKTSIELMKGRFKIKMEPKVVTDLDEAELARQMEISELKSSTDVTNEQLKLGWSKDEDQLALEYEAMYDESLSDMINSFKSVPLPDDNDESWS